MNEPETSRGSPGLDTQIGFLLSTVAVAGNNVMLNPDLDDALQSSDWAIAYPGASGIYLDWIEEDSTGCPNSGSGWLESSTTDIGTQWAEIGQCQAIDQSAWTTGAHSAFSYFSAAALEMAYASFSYYTDTGCGQFDGGHVGFDFSYGPVGPGWHRVALSVASIPPTAQSVLVTLGAEVPQQEMMVLLFDRAYFGQVAEIFADDFEGADSPCWWWTPVP